MPRPTPLYEWTAQPQDGAGYLAYGPYTKTVPSGSRSATFVVAADTTRGAANDILFTLDVYDAASKKQLAVRTIRRGDLTGNNAYTKLRLDFFATAGMNLEFRLHTPGKTSIAFDKVMVA